MKYDWTERNEKVDPELVEGVRGAGYDAPMFDEVPREGSRVPPQITDAEEWRVLGDKLRALSPRLYEEVLTALTAMALPADEAPEKIT